MTHHIKTWQERFKEDHPSRYPEYCNDSTARKYLELEVADLRAFKERMYKHGPVGTVGCDE